MAPNDAAAARRTAAINRELRRLKSRRHFHQTPDGRARIERDLQLVTPFLSGMQYTVDEENSATIVGFMTMDLGRETYRSLRLRIVFPRDYPKSEPAVYDDEGALQPHAEHKLADRHIGESGWFCMWLPPLSPWNAADADAIVTFMRHVATFVERQFLYDIIGEWPDEQWGHGQEGWRQFIRAELAEIGVSIDAFSAFVAAGIPGRRQPCACGNGMHFVNCHRNKLTQLICKLGEGIVQELRSGRLTLHDSPE